MRFLFPSRSVGVLMRSRGPQDILARLPIAREERIDRDSDRFVVLWYIPDRTDESEVKS